MHIPSEMLSTPVCSVSLAVAFVGVVAAAVSLFKRKGAAPSDFKFALVSAVVFGVQMLNYPIFNGISGHLIGGVFAAAMLGVPAGVLALALVLTIQTFLFADGGVMMLGANVLNMAVIGAGFGGWLRAKLIQRGLGAHWSTGIAAAVSVELAVLVLAVQLVASGQATVPAIGLLVAVHAVLAVVEGFATALLVNVCAFDGVRRTAKRGYAVLSGLLIACLALAPFASAFPDAFEWAMGRFSLLPGAPEFVHAPFADYAVSGVGNEMVSVFLAAIVGVLVVSGLGYVLMLPVREKSRG